MSVKTYPEHEKLRALGDEPQAVGEFLEWLTSTRGVSLYVTHRCSPTCDDDCARGDHEEPLSWTTERLLHEFYRIDAKRLEQEKRAALHVQRRLNAGTKVAS